MSTETPTSERRPLDVLLVEDDPGDVVIAREALRAGKLQTRLQVVVDGVEAMAYLRQQDDFADAERPDLILLDLNLPRKSGLEVLSEVKTDPQLRSIPVVVLSTSNAEADVTASYQRHANIYVAKPVDFHDFAAVLGHIDTFFTTVARLPGE